jgi:hypothetical protein
MAKPIKSLVAGFKSPVKRPRFIIWTGVVLIGLAGFIAVALAVSSSRLFCAQVCHKVQDDAIIAYEKSSHSEISCLACHMPVNADPVTFLIHKVEAGVSGGINTVGNKYEMPLNPGSKLSLEGKYMPEGQCTQCHSKNRKVTPSPGIIIDHEVHSKNKISCTTCHNRIAHNEDGWELTLKTVEGKPSKKHPDYMKMMWCYRCHDLEGKKTAPGTCSSCHTPEFPLKPDNHLAAEFYPKGHAELAREDEKQMEERAKEHEELADKVKAKKGDPKMLEPVSYCGTCHIKTKFCDSCHGMAIPHPAEFKEKSHPEVVKTAFAKCVMCHGEPAKTGFCDNCHHGSKVGWTFDVKVPWKTQHAAATTKNGIDKCFTACHDQKFCLDCHTKTKPLPGSHKVGNWLHRANPDPFGKDKAVHAKNAAANIKACEICHGAGGTGSAFCMGCHKLPMAHPAEFKSFHAKTGRDNPKVCSNCHTFKELCSNCHHKGSSLTTGWLPLHGKVIADAGNATDCFAKCHKKDFCVTCHVGRKVVPASHKAKGWTKRAAADQKAIHTTAFVKDKENCTYCHGDGGAESKFCSGCHKMPMPHPSGFGAKDNGGQHKADIAAKKLTREMCSNCHGKPFCDKCHHDYTGSTPWMTTHDDVVKAGDAQTCFKCHKETYCSYCHVRLIR